MQQLQKANVKSYGASALASRLVYLRHESRQANNCLAMITTVINIFNLSNLYYNATLQL